MYNKYNMFIYNNIKQTICNQHFQARKNNFKLMTLNQCFHQEQLQNTGKVLKYLLKAATVKLLQSVQLCMSP